MLLVVSSEALTDALRIASGMYNSLAKSAVGIDGDSATARKFREDTLRASEDLMCLAEHIEAGGAIEIKKTNNLFVN